MKYFIGSFRSTLLRFFNYKKLSFIRNISYQVCFRSDFSPIGSDLVLYLVVSYTQVDPNFKNLTLKIFLKGKTHFKDYEIFFFTGKDDFIRIIKVAILHQQYQSNQIVCEPRNQLKQANI